MRNLGIIRCYRGLHETERRCARARRRRNVDEARPPVAGCLHNETLDMNAIPLTAATAS